MMAEGEQGDLGLTVDKGADAGAADAAALAAKGKEGGDDAAETKANADAKATTDLDTKAKSDADAKSNANSETKAKAEADKKTADAAPVDYAKAIAEAKLPDGVVLDAEATKTAGELFSKHKLPPEVAKDLVNFYANQVKVSAELSAKAFSDQVKAWTATSEKEVTAEDRGIAKTAVTTFFDAETAKVLDAFGLTNHPGFIKSALKIGKAIKDDTFVPGDAGSLNGSADARKHFPNSNMNP